MPVRRGFRALKEFSNSVPITKEGLAFHEEVIASVPLFTAKLTMPPRLSDLTFNHGKHGRPATAEAKRWRKANEWACLFKVKAPIEGPCEVWIRLGLSPKQMQGDVANREKAVTDLLVHCRVLEDDNAKVVVANHQVYDPSVPEGFCVVEVRRT